MAKAKTSEGKWATITDMLTPQQQVLLKTRSVAAQALHTAHKALAESITAGQVAPEGKAFIVKVKGTWVSLGIVDATPAKATGDRPATLAEWIAAQAA